MATRRTNPWDTTTEKTVSASEAKNSFGSLVAWVRAENEPVVVESRGVPVAAIISYDELEEFRVMKRRKQKQQAVESLKALRKEVRARNTDLSDEDAERIAQDIVSGAVASLVAKGKVRFED